MISVDYLRWPVNLLVDELFILFSVENITRSKPMFNKKKKVLVDEKGQGMTEYIIIVALIAIASITIVGFFGDNIRGLFAGAGDQLTGSSNTSTTTYGSGDVDKSSGTVGDSF